MQPVPRFVYEMGGRGMVSKPSLVYMHLYIPFSPLQCAKPYENPEVPLHDRNKNGKASYGGAQHSSRGGYGSWVSFADRACLILDLRVRRQV